MWAVSAVLSQHTGHVMHLTAFFGLASKSGSSAEASSSSSKMLVFFFVSSSFGDLRLTRGESVIVACVHSARNGHVL